MGGGVLVKRIYADRQEDAQLQGQGMHLDARSAARGRRLGRPGQVDAGGASLVDAPLRLGADHGADLGLASGNADGGLMQEPHRALAAHGAVDGAGRGDVELGAQLARRVGVAPAQLIDDVQRGDARQEPAARIGVGLAQGGLHQGQGLKGLAKIGRAIERFADADDDGDAVGAHRTGSPALSAASARW